MSDIAQKFVKDEIVKDLKINSAPQKILEVKYSGGETVNLGNELTPRQVKDVPTLKWDSEQGVYYTVLMTDLDAMSRVNPFFREVRHWLVINVQNNDINQGDTVVEYIGSGPPQGTGLHRYVFLVFKQNDRIGTSAGIKRISKDKLDGRLKTSTVELTKTYQLSQPIAGNYYQAQYDDYVLEQNKSMNDGILFYFKVAIPFMVGKISGIFKK